MKKIICVNQVAGPLMIDMLNVLARNKCDVVLYTGEIAKTSTSLSEDVKVKKLIRYKKSNPMARVLTWLGFFLQVCILLFFESNKNTKIYLTSNPPASPWLAIFLRGEVYVHIYDVFPNALLALPWVSKTSFIYKVFLFLNQKAFGAARLIFTPSSAMRDMLLVSTQPEKVKVIPWWADTDFIKPINRSENKFIKRHNLEDKFVILYSGNFGLTHNIEKLLYSAEELQSRDDIVFVVIGGGPKSHVVNAFQRTKGLKNLLVLPFQDEEMLPHSLTAADISVVLDSFSVGQNTDSTASIPSKTYYMMAAGSAIYGETDVSSELSDLINGHKVGMCDDSQTIDQFVNFVLTCRDDSGLLKFYKANSRATSLRFTKENAKLLHGYLYG